MAAVDAPPGKRCLYEVLGVSRDCSADEIRAAYKRLALRLHPDKVATANSGVSSAAATAAFQEVLHAYEVLSDPKERAWYDSHRSQILFSSNHRSQKSPSFFDVDLYAYCSPSAYSGFTDTGRGFYKVYGDLFGKLYSNELFFCSRMGLSSDCVPPAPLMGNLECPYSQVTAFYNYWFGFSTVMDFAWVDEYDSVSGPNRRSRRLMEEENKKIRRKAKREYNDSVRGLVAFVKKRDKRVIEMAMKKDKEEQLRRAEEKKRKEEAKKKKGEQARAYEDPEWARVDEEFVEEDLGFDDLENSRKNKGGEEFYCVACNKKFKSEKQWKNHEQSKKHKEKVAELRDSFVEEEEVLSGSLNDEEEVHVGFDYIPAVDDDSDTVSELCEEFNDAIDIELQEDDQEKDEKIEGGKDDDNIEEENDEASILEAMLSGRKSRRSCHVSPDFSSKSNFSPNNEDDSMEYDTRRKGRKNRGRRRAMKAEVDNYREEPAQDKPDARDKPDDTGHNDCEVGNAGKNLEGAQEDLSSSLEAASLGSIKNLVEGNNQNSKRKQKEVKGGKNKANAETKSTSKGRKQKGARAPATSCDTCGESFESRNKLFAHLGDTGHAMLKSR